MKRGQPCKQKYPGTTAGIMPNPNGNMKVCFRYERWLDRLRELERTQSVKETVLRHMMGGQPWDSDAYAFGQIGK